MTAICEAQEASNEITKHVQFLARQFILRQADLGLRGKRRDDHVVEFFVGAANMALALGNERLAARISGLLDYSLCIRGFRGVEELVASK